MVLNCPATLRSEFLLLLLLIFPSFPFFFPLFFYKESHRRSILGFTRDETSDSSPEEEVLSPASPVPPPEEVVLEANGKSQKDKKGGHRRGRSESGSKLYQSEDEHEETPWQPPVERVSALKTLDGGAEAIFKKRTSSVSSRKDTD